MLLNDFGGWRFNRKIYHFRVGIVMENGVFKGRSTPDGAFPYA